MESIEQIIVNPKKIGERIRRLRKEKKLKVTDISDKMGFETPQAVYKWQRGDCLPEISNLITLSRMLGTTVEDIILGDEERSSSRHIRDSYERFRCIFLGIII